MNLEHCFTASMTAHSITILSELKNVPLWPVRRREDALSISCIINCTLLKAVPNVQQLLNFVDSWLVHVFLDKAVN